MGCLKAPVHALWPGLWFYSFTWTKCDKAQQPPSLTTVFFNLDQPKLKYISDLLAV